MSYFSKKNEQAVAPNKSYNKYEHEKKNGYDFECPMKPINFLLSIFAMNRFPTTKQYKKILHGVITIIILITISIVSIIDRTHSNYIDASLSFVLIDLINNLTLLSTGVCNICVSCFQSNALYETFIENQALIDRLLGFKEGKFKHALIIAIQLILVATLPAIVIGTAYAYIVGYFFGIRYVLSYSINIFFYLVNSIVMVQFVLSLYSSRMVLYTLKIQLELYEKIKCGDSLDSADNVSVNSSWATKYFEDKEFIFPWKKLGQISRDIVVTQGFDFEDKMNAYIKICEQTDLITSFFGLQNLLLVLNTMVSIIRSLQVVTSSTFGTEVIYENEVFSIGVMVVCLCLALYDISMLLCATALCAVTTKEAKQISAIVDSFLYKKPLKHGENERLELWSHLIARRAPNFNAAGFFTLDFTLIYSMAGGISTYLIILLQLK